MSAGGKRRIFFNVKALVNVVGIADHRRVQLFVHARLVQCHRRLDEVARAVQLVLGALFKDVFRLVHLKITVEIAVRQLVAADGADIGDRLVRPTLQLRVFLFGENVGDRFQPFGNVRIPENVRLVRVVADAFHGAEPARLFKPLINVVDGNFGVELLQIADKPFPDLYLFKIDGLHEKYSCQIFSKRKAPPRYSPAG